jgi:hypothetical protein
VLGAQREIFNVDGGFFLSLKTTFFCLTFFLGREVLCMSFGWSLLRREREKTSPSRGAGAGGSARDGIAEEWKMGKEGRTLGG